MCTKAADLFSLSVACVCFYSLVPSMYVPATMYIAWRP